MPFRRLPNSVDTLDKAMIALRDKMSTNPTSLPFSDALSTRFQAFAPGFVQKVVDSQSLLQDQGKATVNAVASQEKLAMIESHFIQVFNFRIARGESPATDRAFYKIDFDDDTVPKLTSKADVKLWAGQLTLGEAKRVSKGGAPMVDPSATLLQNASNDYTAKLKIQSDFKTSYDKIQEELAAMLEEGLELIRDIWDEIEFTYHKEKPPSMRRKSMEWGVVYVLRPDEQAEEGVLPAEGV